MTHIVVLHDFPIKTAHQPCWAIHIHHTNPHLLMSGPGSAAQTEARLFLGMTVPQEQVAVSRNAGEDGTWRAGRRRLSTLQCQGTRPTDVPPSVQSANTKTLCVHS